MRELLFMKMTEETRREEEVKEYFKCGFEYMDILKLLYERHGIQISLRTLHRILKKHGLQRRNIQKIDSYRLIKAINKISLDGGENRGYRNVHHRLIEQGIQLSRETTRVALKELDPEGCEKRARHKLKRRSYHSKGPNEVWHIDGNDKLKPFGFYIHGAIDGFSRKILWLRVANTNKDPAVIAYYYVNQLKRSRKLPRRIRGMF